MRYLFYFRKLPLLLILMISLFCAPCYADTVRPSLPIQEKQNPSPGPQAEPNNDSEARKNTAEMTASDSAASGDPRNAASIKDKSSSHLPMTEAETDEWYSGSCFVGDSIMLGFQRYAGKRCDTWLGSLHFLCAGSFGVNHALNAGKKGAICPMLRGEQVSVWEGLRALDTHRVFLCFGLNDLNISGLEGSRDKYAQLIDLIREQIPDIDIHIISMTPTCPGIHKGKLYNPTIREYNALLQTLAKEKNTGFVDLTEALTDENGDLRMAYCSDDYVHITPEGYDAWCAVLRAYPDSLR